MPAKIPVPLVALKPRTLVSVRSSECLGLGVAVVAEFLAAPTWGTGDDVRRTVDARRIATLAGIIFRRIEDTSAARASAPY